MTKKEKKALAQQALDSSIEKFREAMEAADIGFIATMTRPTMRMKQEWMGYVEACKRLLELGD